MRRVWAILAVVALVIVLPSSVLGEEDPRALAGKLDSTSEILEYRAFPTYNEAPSLAKLVAEGKLPPVEERLPKEPLVWKRSVMPDGIGVYGDRIRWTVGSTPAGWNAAAGQIQGWGGVGPCMGETLVSSPYMWMLKAPEPAPKLARSWEWSDDGMSLTMYLVEGARWSDGVEFTADDVLFWYYDNILDDQVPNRGTAGSWTFGGKVTELEKIAAYTIRWHFGEPFPLRVLFEMGDPVKSIVAPAHICKHFHPKYNPEMTYQDYLMSTPPEAVPAVTLGAFVPVAYKEGQQMVFVRNPFYYQVDEEGNQLPYWDEIVVKLADNWNQWALDMIAGVADKSQVKPELQAMFLAKASEPDANYIAQWGYFLDNYHLFLNLSRYASVDNDRDRALRELFRDIRFREAVSRLVNRDGIATGVFPAPSTHVFYGGYPSGSTEYSEEAVVAYPYDPGRAKELLAELGFVDTDGNGILNWPEGSLIAGEELIIEAIASAEDPDYVSIGEALLPAFRDAGIDLRLKPLKRALLTARENIGDFEIDIVRNDSAATPWLHPKSIGPMGVSSPAWHLAGVGGERDLLPFEMEIGALLASTATMTSATGRKETFAEILTLYTENIYTVGIVESRMGLGYAKRFRNEPSDFPIRGFGTEDTAVPIGIRWTPKDQQLETLFQNLIPTLETYGTQAWYPRE